MFLCRLKREARVNEPVKFRGTAPIVAAIQYDKPNIYKKLLMDSRVDINDVVTTSGGHKLLHWAVMCGNIQAISAIAGVPGANVNIVNDAGETPLMLAVKVQ